MGRSFQGIYQRWILIVVSGGIMMDWSTTYFLGLDPEAFSFTKFVVVPVILCDLMFRFTRYLNKECVVYGGLFAAGVVVCLQGPSLEEFDGALVATKLLPNILVLVFYSACSRDDELLVVLRVMFFASLVVVACMVLAYFNILAPVDYIAEGNITRITAGTSWSTLPLFLSIPASTLGGLLLMDSRKTRLRTIGIPIAAAIGLATLFAALVSGQRTSAALFALCLVSSAVLYLSNMSWRNFLITLVVLALTLLLVQQLSGQFTDASSTLVERTTGSTTGDMLGNVEDRSLMYSTFFEALFTDPSIRPPGMAFFVQRAGNIPHLILGEAYCYGGLIMLFAVAFLFYRAWRNDIETWLNRRKRPTENARVSLLVILLGFSLTLSFHPGLHTRMVYMVLGLSLARHSRMILNWMPTAGAPAPR